MSQQKANLCYSNLATGMAHAVMTEIAEGLKALSEGGAEAAIDLRSLPLTEADLTELRELLDKGEVNARIDVIGETEVYETGFAGVWWIRHFGSGQQVASEEIVIAPVPAIVRSQPEDIEQAVKRIYRQLEADQSERTEREAIHG